MNKFLLCLFLVGFAFSSCKTQQFNDESVSIFIAERVGEKLPEYLFLKKYDRTFDFYYPMGQTSVLGTWKILNDTLFLFPYYEYSSQMHRLEPEDSSIISISQKYLIHKGNLIDITDYSVLSLDKNSNYKIKLKHVN